jgi:hypothetical protein
MDCSSDDQMEQWLEWPLAEVVVLSNNVATECHSVQPLHDAASHRTPVAPAVCPRWFEFHHVDI